jgi:hypothetical protein
VPDLMAALEASLAAVKDPGAGGKSNGKKADGGDSKAKSKAKKSGSRAKAGAKS